MFDKHCQASSMQLDFRVYRAGSNLGLLHEVTLWLNQKPRITAMNDSGMGGAQLLASRQLSGAANSPALCISLILTVPI